MLLKCEPQIYTIEKKIVKKPQSQANPRTVNPAHKTYISLTHTHTCAPAHAHTHTITRARAHTHTHTTESNLHKKVKGVDISLAELGFEQMSLQGAFK